MELALSTREVEAALSAISNVVDAVPSEAVPVLTVRVSILGFEVLPANTFGLTTDRLPVLTD